MPLTRVLVPTLLILLARLGYAQAAPTTIAEAEAEGARFAHGAPPATVPAAFGRRPFGGAVERRCVAAPVSDDSLPSGSLRSGDIIVRTRFGERGLRAGRGGKALWIPLHGGPNVTSPLLLRAVQLGGPASALRQTVEGLARSGVRGRAEFGYPSAIRFPSAGRWLVVATAGDDWGCFVLDVAK
jgi:hypothetical protein